MAAIRVTDPQDVSFLAPTPDEALTLITCYLFGRSPRSPQRFIVRATPLEAGTGGKFGSSRGGSRLSRRALARTHGETSRLLESSQDCGSPRSMALRRRTLISDLLSRWPLIRQIKTGADGTGVSQCRSKPKPPAKASWSRGHPLHLSLLRRWLRAACLSQARQADFDRRRSRVADFPRPSLSQGRRYLRTAHPSRSPEKSEVSPPVFHASGKNSISKPRWTWSPTGLG